MTGYPWMAILALPFVAGACLARATPQDGGDPGGDPFSASCPSAPETLRTADDSARHAVRCAEDVVARRGYTKRPPPIVQLPGESDEQTRRRAQEMEFWVPVQAEAYGLCRGPRWAYLVVFKYERDSIPGVGDFTTRVGKALEMDRAFDNLHLHHQDFLLEVVDNRVEGCRPLARRGAGARAGPA